MDDSATTTHFSKLSGNNQLRKANSLFKDLHISEYNCT